MKFFNSEPTDKTIKLLKDSQRDFPFDRDLIKNRLFASIKREPVQNLSSSFFTFRFIKYTASFAVAIIFLSATFVFASNARPGDKLFALNKFGEKIILSLPLSMEQKAKVQAGIVTRRLEALQEVETQTAGPGLEAKQLETVKESDESIQNAIDTVTASKIKLENSGHAANAQKLSQVLNQIDTLAQKHEDRIKKLEASLPDQTAQQAIDEHLTGIRNSRHKASAAMQLNDQKADDPVDSIDPKLQQQKTDKPGEPQAQRKFKKNKENNPGD